MLAKNFLTTIFLLCCSTVALWWGCRFANAAGDLVKIAVGDVAWARMNALDRMTRDENVGEDLLRLKIKGMLNEWLKEAEVKKDTNAVKALKQMVERHDEEHNKGEWRCPPLNMEIFVEKVSLLEEHVMKTMTQEESTRKQKLLLNATETNIKLGLYRAEGVEQVQTAFGEKEGNLLSFNLQGYYSKRTFDERLSEVLVAADVGSDGSYEFPPDSIKPTEIPRYQWAAPSALNTLDTAELYMGASSFYLKATVTEEIKLIKLVNPWHELRERIKKSESHHSQLVTSGASVGKNSDKPSAGHTAHTASTP